MMQRNALVAISLLSLASLASASTLDPLRNIRSELWSIDFITRFAVGVLVLVVFAIALLAYRRSPTRRMLLVLGAFGFFALEWILKIADLFLTPGWFFTTPLENIFELAIVLLLCIAIFKK